MSETVNITPMFSPTFMRKAMEQQQVNLTISDDGKLNLPDDVNECHKLIAQLGGALLTAHIIETRVVASNAQSLLSVADDIDCAASELKGNEGIAFGLRCDVDLIREAANNLLGTNRNQ